MAVELITVVTPYRNAAPFLPGFVAMLQAQTSSQWCCLLVDDGSSDDGPALAAQLTAADQRFSLIRRSRPKPAGSGPAAARNTALALVSTELVAFCDIDDLWHPQKLERQLQLQRRHQLDLVVSGYGRFGDGPEPRIIDWRCPPPVLSYRRLLGGNPIPMLTVLVRTALVRGGMPTGPHEDFALWLALFRRCPDLRYGCLPEGLAFYRLHSGNLTGQRWRMAGWAHQVFVAHGLKGAALWMAMARWLAYQARNLIRRRPRQGRSGPPQDLAALMRQPPRPLRPSSS
jgi:teichuronic acid biosynthesis glycosyltransferase TuaG